MNNDRMSLEALICCTGWHALSRGFDLRDEFWGMDCEPMDAPEFITAGSTRKTQSGNVKIVSNTVYRG